MVVAWKAATTATATATRPRIIDHHGGQSRWNDLGSSQNGEDASIFPLSNFGCIFTLKEFKI